LSGDESEIQRKELSYFVPLVTPAW